jgi:Tfp pilus assembly protein PilF
LLLKLTGGERERLAKRYTEDVEAYQLYLKGRYYWNKRSPEGFRKAVQSFQGAIEKDPNYALAYSGLADCYSMMGAEFCLNAKAAALRAIEMDDTLAEAHTSLAFIMMRQDWNWGEVEKHLMRAVESNPNYATAHQWYSIYLELNGRPQEAVKEAYRARELDPLSPIINESLGDRLYFAKRFDESIEVFRNLAVIEPDFVAAQDTRVTLGLAYLQNKMDEQAAREFTVLAQTAVSPVASAFLAYAYALRGRKDAARARLGELLKGQGRGDNLSLATAIIYLGLGEKEKALEWLSRSVDQRDSSLVFVKVDPIWDSIREDARFHEVVGRIGAAQ